jgi:ABC-type uncharacterized transport system involved in gliding motility auxiliary subunit
MSTRTKLQGSGLAAIIIGATIAIVVFVNTISGAVFGRLDLTESNLNTLSEASKAAVADLGEFEVSLYMSPDLPETIRDEMGRNRVMRHVSQKFLDTLNEYRSYSDGNLTIHRVTQDVVDQARNAKLRVFSGDEATAKGGRLQFKEYVLGATFHYKNAMEVLPLALYPEHYEFEITKIMVRLKEKVAKSILMKDVLSAGEELSGSVSACAEAYKTAEPSDDAPTNPFGLVSKEASQARLTALTTNGDAIGAACDPLNASLTTAKGLSGKHPAMDQLTRIADIYAQTRGQIAQVLTGPEEERARALQGIDQLAAIATEVVNAHDTLVDSPGRRSIGFICAGKAFCPFPESRPLIPKELEGVIGQKNPFATQIVGQLGKMTERMNMILSNIERNLFKKKGFNIKRVDINAEIPSDVEALVLFGAKADLTDWQLFQVDQFVMGGGSLVVFLNAWDVALMNLSAKGDARVTALGKNTSNIGELLASWGVKPTGKLVAEPTSNDEVTVMALIRQGSMTWQTQRQFPYPILPVLKDMDASSPLVRAVSSITLPFTTSLELSSESGVTVTPLISTTEDAVTVDMTDFPLEPTEQATKVNALTSDGVQVVAAVATGLFKSHFTGKEAPKSPEEPTPPGEEKKAEEEDKAEEPTKRLEQGEGRVLVIGSNLGLEDLSPGSIMPDFDLGQLTGGSFEVVDQFRGWAANLQNWEVRLGQIQHTLPDNIQFLFNVLDWSIQQEALVEIRSKQYQRRPLEQLDEGSQSLVTLTAIIGGPLLFIIFGLLRLLARKKRRRGLAALGNPQGTL